MNDIFGKTLGRYILLELLGEGGMAKVYNAFDPRLEKNVAIKIILPSHQHSKLFLERFNLEAKSLAQLSHSSIVKVLDYGEEDNRPYIVMEYIGGGTLREHLAMPVRWDKAAAILAPIARALEYVHKQNLVHRDVKPSNILLDNNNQPMLSDFGVVKLMEAEESVVAATGVGIGTPDYMSPEQATGKEVGFQADIYALGVVFFELVTGKKPFYADTPMAVVIKHVANSFPKPRAINRKIPPFVEKVILKAVQKNPEQRYKNMGEFVEALELLTSRKRLDQRRLKQLTSLERTPPKYLRPVLVMGIILGLISLAFLKKDMVSGVINKIPSGIAQSPTAIIATTTPEPDIAGMPTVVDAVVITATVEEESSTRDPGYISNRSSVRIQGDSIKYSIELSDDKKEIARWGLGGVNSVEWSPDGKTILVGTTSGGFVFNTDDLSHEYFLDGGSPGWVQSAIFSHDGSNFFIANKNGLTTNFNLGNRTNIGLTTLKYEKPRSESNRLTDERKKGVLSLELDPTGENIAVGHANGALNIWNISKNSIVMNVDQFPIVTDLAFSMDGRNLYACNQSTDLIVWDVATGKIEKQLPHSTKISFVELSDNGSYMITAGEAQAVYLWDAVDERIIHTFNYLGATPTSITISPDSNLFAFGLSNGSIKVFGLPQEGTFGANQKEIFMIEGNTDAITSLAFSPDGMKLASTSWKDGLRIWDTKTGLEIISLEKPNPQITDMRFSPNGNLLAVEHDSKQVEVWDVYNAKPLYKVDGYLAEGDVFSPKSDLLIIAQEGIQKWSKGQLVVLSAKNGKALEILPGYQKDWRVYFYPDQSLFVEGNRQSAMIWDVSTWEKLNIQGGPNAGCGQFFTPDNRRLAVISDVGIYEQFGRSAEYVCSIRPQNAKMHHFEGTMGVFTVNNGVIFEVSFANINVEWLKTDKTLLSHKDQFIAGSGSRYAFSRDNLDLNIARISSRRNHPTIIFTTPWYEEYKYSVAFSPKDNLIALGTKFGSIHVYKIK